MRADQETLDLLPVDLLRIVRDLELGEMVRLRERISKLNADIAVRSPD